MIQLVVDPRVDALERELRDLEARFEAVEAAVNPRPRTVVSPPSAPAAPRKPLRGRPSLALGWDLSPSPKLEDLLGGRLLALVGGAAFLLGIAFLVALAIERGWVGETTRVVLAFLGSGLVLGVGLWLHERHGRTQATLAMVGAGIAGLYLSLAAATALYSLIPAAAALAGAVAVGALAAALAVRWNSRTVAGLGIVGTLLAPALSQSLTTTGMAFLAVASAAACAVTVWRRWDWLTIVAFLVSMPQVVLWSFDAHSSATLVAVLGAFAALNLATAVGFELRVRAGSLRPSSALLSLFGALVVASVGYFQLPHGEGELAGGVWMAALALVYGALGLAALRSRHVGDQIGLLLLAIGLTVGDIAFGSLASGLALVAGWAASAAVLGVAARRLGVHRALGGLTLGSQLALAAGHTLLFEATPRAIASGAGDTGAAAAALGAVVVGAFASGRLTANEAPGRRAVLDTVSLAALACLSAVTLDGIPLVLAWAFEAAALAELGVRLRDGLTRAGAYGFLGLAALHVLAFEAPPKALLYGPDNLAAAAAGLVAVFLTALRLIRAASAESPERKGLVAVATAAVVYLCSVAIVTPFQPGPEALDTGLTLGVRQQGQVLLSAFWAVLGFACLLVGLRRSRRPLRLVGFGLLTLTAAKVFLYDLAALASMYRVASLVATGLLLLTAAYAYQRLRSVQ